MLRAPAAPCCAGRTTFTRSSLSPRQTCAGLLSSSGPRRCMPAGMHRAAVPFELRCGTVHAQGLTADPWLPAHAGSSSSRHSWLQKTWSCTSQVWGGLQCWQRRQQLLGAWHTVWQRGCVRSGSGAACTDPAPQRLVRPRATVLWLRGSLPHALAFAEQAALPRRAVLGPPKHMHTCPWPRTHMRPSPLSPLP